MICFSHKDKFLIDHLKNVEAIGINVFRNKTFKFNIKANELEIALKNTLFLHDFAKATKFFQEYLKSSIDSKPYKGSLEQTKHSQLSALFAAYLTKQSTEDNRLPIVVFIAIKKHHGNLANIDDMLSIKNSIKILKLQWENIIWDDFSQANIDLNIDFDGLRKNTNFEKLENFGYDLLWEQYDTANLYYLVNLFFSILTYSDKTDVLLGGTLGHLVLPQDIDNFVKLYKSSKFTLNQHCINQIREDAYSHVERSLLDNRQGSIFAINLPTGFGKTLTSINCAMKLCRNSYKRIIYALPYTSIVEQTSLEIEKILVHNGYDFKDYVTIHHHLSEVKVKIDDEYLIEDKAQLIIENWDKPIIVTTFWQLFNALISNKNSILRKFHNLSDTIIILDEIQTIPYKYWELVKKVLNQVSILLNCKIILLTATMPMIFSIEEKEVIPLVKEKNRQYYFSVFNRYSINKINNLEPIDIKILFDIAIKHLKQHPNHSFMFIFNTIKTSQDFFDLIKNNIEHKNLFYLSSLVLPIDRKKTLDLIKNTSQKILISTQVVEAGLDLDFDIVYRDFAPLDCIIQSAGRCNRNNKSHGEVYLFNLANNQNKSYSSFIYSNLLLSITKEMFNKIDCLEENKLLEFINEFYSLIKQRHSKNESLNIQQAIENLNYDVIEKDFKLIEEAPQFLLFIEKDDSATDILKQFKEIINISNKFEKRKKFLNIRASFFDYVISIRKNDFKSYKTIKSFEEIGNFIILGKELADIFYNDTTGFKITESEIFI